MVTVSTAAVTGCVSATATVLGDTIKGTRCTNTMEQTVRLFLGFRGTRRHNGPPLDTLFSAAHSLSSYSFMICFSVLLPSKLFYPSVFDQHFIYIYFLFHACYISTRIFSRILGVACSLRSKTYPHYPGFSALSSLPPVSRDMPCRRVRQLGEVSDDTQRLRCNSQIPQDIYVCLCPMRFCAFMKPIFI